MPGNALSTPTATRALGAPILLGIGLGGLIDGVVFHQLLHWHNMMSAVVPPADMAALRYNVVADGLFHAATAVLLALGVALLWLRARRCQPLPAAPHFGGGLLVGIGLFNTVEGVVNHHLLKLHNVREVADPMPWNIGFLLIGGAGLILVGLWLIRDRRA